MQGAPKPIRSLYYDDPELEDRLDAFILGLSEALDDLQDAVMVLDWSNLIRLTLDLLGSARALGYPALIEILREVQSAAESGDGEGARKSVSELTEIAQRVRRGHHTSA